MSCVAAGLVDDVPLEVIREGKEQEPVLWTIFVLLMILWLLGIVSSYTLGGFIHVLLLLAIATVLIRIIQGRNPI
jgi:asparagine N-glycosylation enzyme membrane subunit Stt3